MRDRIRISRWTRRGEWRVREAATGRLKINTAPGQNHIRKGRAHEYLMNGIIAGILLVLSFGCTSSIFITRPVEDEPSLLVGLTTYHDKVKAAEVRHDHPVDWSAADLQAILKRLAIQEGIGLLDSSSPPQAVFALEDLTTLTPALQETFKLATPSDWIVFAVWGSSGTSQALEVTSGGMYLQDQRLHIMLANHRERVSSEQEGIQAIHNNPFRAMKDVKRRLMFYPTSYVIESRSNWIAGGFDSPVSELILDYQALLATKSPDTPTGTKEVTASDIPEADSTPARSTDAEVGVLKEEITNLKEELSRLQQQINQQAEERSRTKVSSPTRPPSTSDPNQPSP